MGIDLSRLEKVKHQGGSVIARCPACAEAGGDKTGNHLFVNSAGHFGCVLYPGEEGKQHRQKIFELAGAREGVGQTERACGGFEIKKLPSCLYAQPKIIFKDILGRLGHLNLTYAGIENKNNDNINKDCEKDVPSVPNTENDPSANDLGQKTEKKDLL